MKTPQRCTAKELAKVGVTLAGAETGHLRLTCNDCGQTWAPDAQPGGGAMPRGYWRCPHGCNRPA